MYLVVTRTFPPDVGGMQNLMGGLARSLSKIDLIKVFADYNENHEDFDKKVSFSVERIKGIKLLRKYRKPHLVNEYLNQNPKVKCIISDHWKSLELIKTNKKKICLIHSKEINPSFSSAKTECINNQEYGHAMKIAMQYQKRFWDDDSNLSYNNGYVTIKNRLDEIGRVHV